MTNAYRVFLFLTAVAVCCCHSLYAQHGGGPTNVEAAVVERGFVLDEVRLTGTIQPRRATRVSTDVPARVVEVLVDEGSFVRAGDPMAQLDSGPITHQVAESEARLRLEQAALDELLNGTREEDLNIKRALVAEKEADLDLQKSEFARFERLLAEQAVSRSDYDRALAELHKAEAQLAREKAELALAVEGPRPERIEAGRAMVSAAQARLADLRSDHEKHTIRAPFDGVVGNKYVEAGQWAATGDILFSLAEVTTLRASVEVPERYFHRIALGDKAVINVDAVGVTVEAPVTIKVPLGNTASRTFPVRIDLDNSTLKLAPGMLARVDFSMPIEGARESLLVPKDAVVLTPDGKRSVWVAVETPGGVSAESREIEAGRSSGRFVELLSSNLKEGDLVIVRGNETLFPGQSIALTRQQGTEAVDTGTARHLSMGEARP